MYITLAEGSGALPSGSEEDDADGPTPPVAEALWVRDGPGPRFVDFLAAGLRLNVTASNGFALQNSHG